VVSVVHITCHHGILLSLEVGNTCMICPPSPDVNPTSIFPFLSVGMEGGIHYPYLHLHQALPQGLPVSYKGWTNCLPDRSACSHEFQVGEKASSSTPPLYQLTQSFRHIPLSVTSMHRSGPLSFVATVKELGYRPLKTSVLRYDDYLNMPGHYDLM
jgi:hypothetical protein